MAEPGTEVQDRDVIYYLRDINQKLVDAWTDVFAGYEENIKISKGDIFKGGPAADAIVSPANSFGFMDGGIDMAYTNYFGIQMQKRLQKLLRSEHEGELLVGEAVIIPAYESEGRDETLDWSNFNEGVAIKYLICAPTMRVPADVCDTVNAYLAFRAVILAVRKHNQRDDVEPIKSVLVPGLGTAVGRMPKLKCAWQMLQAYETFVCGMHPARIMPRNLKDMYMDNEEMREHGDLN